MTSEHKGLLIAIVSMAAVIVASNFLVQFPVHATLGAINLADLLTWGAFTFPAAYLITDLMNRRFGAKTARKLVIAGFIIAVIVSIYLATPRIAIASGTAFLVAQLIDVSIFDRLRGSAWWQAPVASSVLGSVIDTILFFAIAFSLSFAFLGDDTFFANEAAPFLGVASFETARWISWAAGDLGVKLFVALAMLIPYRLLLPVAAPAGSAQA